MQLLQMLLTLLVLPLGTWAHVLRPQAVVARAMRAMPAVSSRAVPRCPVAVLSAAETTTAPVSFVQTEMRSAAMKLHTRDQAREGEQKAQKPVTSWQPGRPEYLQFLVNSRAVYAAFEEIVEEIDEFAPFRDSGLERVAALDLDIEWFREQGVETPPLGEEAVTYVSFLRNLAAERKISALVCHFYNFYFAHTAGGRMIGKMMSTKLLDGHTLNFYQWTKGDVDKELLPALRLRIDEMAAAWSREAKDECLAETASSFKLGGALMNPLSAPKSQ